MKGDWEVGYWSKTDEASFLRWESDGICPCVFWNLKRQRNRRTRVGDRVAPEEQWR